MNDQVLTVAKAFAALLEWRAAYAEVLAVRPADGAGPALDRLHTAEAELAKAADALLAEVTP